MENDHSPVNGMDVGSINEIGSVVIVATCVDIGVVVGDPALQRTVEIKRLTTKKIVVQNLGFVISCLSKERNSFCSQGVFTATGA
jgi:hypothetical protein